MRAAKWAASELGMTTATTTGETTRTTEKLAAEATSKAAEIAANVSAVESYSAVAAAGAAASVASIPYVGPVMAVAAAADTYAMLQPYALIASAAGGFDAPSGDRNPVTQLHGGEMVLPADISNMVRSMAAGGGGATVHNHHYHLAGGMSGDEFRRSARQIGQQSARANATTPRQNVKGVANERRRHLRREQGAGDCRHPDRWQDLSARALVPWNNTRTYRPGERASSTAQSPKAFRSMLPIAIRFESSEHFRAPVIQTLNLKLVLPHAEARTHS